MKYFTSVLELEYFLSHFFKIRTFIIEAFTLNSKTYRKEKKNLRISFIETESSCFTIKFSEIYINRPMKSIRGKPFQINTATQDLFESKWYFKCDFFWSNNEYLSFYGYLITFINIHRKDLIIATRSRVKKAKGLNAYGMAFGFFYGILFCLNLCNLKCLRAGKKPAITLAF